MRAPYRQAARSVPEKPVSARSPSGIAEEIAIGAALSLPPLAGLIQHRFGLVEMGFASVAALVLAQVLQRFFVASERDGR